MYEKNQIYSLILLEGSKQILRMAVDDLNQHFPSISQETAEETSRHREWLQKDIGALHLRVRNRHITMAFRLVTSAPLSLLSAPAVLQHIADFRDRWRNQATIILSHIDTRTVPEATAAVIWTANGKTQGVIGSLGNNRGVYFGIMRHFFHRDDAMAFFQALTTHQIAPIPYQHKEQWSVEHSPLRLEFRNQDPHRNGLGFDSASGHLLVVGGFLPADDVCITVETNWINGLTVLLHGDQHGILPAFDDDGQLTVSGYALYAASVIDVDLRPTAALDDAERRRVGLDTSATESDAMRSMLLMYRDWLRAALEHEFHEDPESIIASRLRDHLESATRWLSEDGPMKGSDQAG